MDGRDYEADKGNMPLFLFRTQLAFFYLFTNVYQKYIFSVLQVRVEMEVAEQWKVVRYSYSQSPIVLQPLFNHHCKCEIWKPMLQGNNGVYVYLYSAEIFDSRNIKSS